MLKRGRMNKGRSKRLFSKTANRVHKKNLPQRGIMRGGMRL